MALEPRGKPARGTGMANISAAKTFTAIVSVAALGAAFSFGAGTALAQDKSVTEDQILRALAPEKKPLTRGLSTGPQAVVDPAVVAAEGKFVQKIRGRSTRSLSSAEREEIAAIVKDKPKIDLEINFDYNSADISAKSLPSVQALGRALTNNDLKGSTFVVAGHTDAPTRSSAISSTNMASTAPISSPSDMARASSRIRASRWRK